LDQRPRQHLHGDRGVPKAVVCDNLKAGSPAVAHEPGINRTYQDLAEHYGFAVLPARVRKPRDKAKVERRCKSFSASSWRGCGTDGSSRCWSSTRIRECVADLNAKVMRKIGKSRAELLETMERPALDALPAEPYRYAEWRSVWSRPTITSRSTSTTTRCPRG